MQSSIPGFDIDSAGWLADDALAPGLAVQRDPGWLSRLLRHPSALVGLTVIALFVVVAIVIPVLIPFDPASQNLSAAFLPPLRAGHLLGTDELGRDEFLQLVYGARYSLSLGFMAVVLGLAVGAPIGSLSGYLSGAFDLIVQRGVDVLLSFPGFLLALGLVALLGPGLRNVVIAVAVSSLPAFIRLARASALAAREQPYVDAARGLGASTLRIVATHVLPNSLAPLIVQASLQMGTAILLAAGLGFLGLGVQPPTPEWGQMIGSAQDYIFHDSNLATFPGLAIFFVVIAFNLVGDGLRDVLDPRSSQ
jgi:peptide/nickel transport system permease protein